MTRVIHSFQSDTRLPPELCDGSAWYGSELVRRRDLVEHFSEIEISEVEKPVQGLEESETDLLEITADDVPLPKLAPRLRAILDEVLNGRGFVLIRSLPVERWTRRQAAI